MRLTSRLFILVLCGGEAISTAPLMAPDDPSYDNLNNKLAPISAFAEGGLLDLSQNDTGLLVQYDPLYDLADWHWSEWTSRPPVILPLPVTSNCGSSTAWPSTFVVDIRSWSGWTSRPPVILPLPVTSNRGSSTAWPSTFVVNIRSFQRRLETAAKLSVALCIAVRTAVGNRVRVDSIALRRLVIDSVVALGGAFRTVVGNRFRVDGVELRRRVIDGIVVAFSVSIVSSIASYYVLNKIQGQAVTFVVDPEVVKKLLQDDDFKLRSCKSLERQ